MAKDAKGHGSNGRGGTTGDQIRNAQTQRAEGAAAGMSADALAANALAAGVPKGKGLVGVHSASAISHGITKMRLAFRNSDS